MTISLSPGRIAGVVLAGAVAITGANAAVQVLDHALGHGHLLGLGWLVDVDGEQNLASWFASGQFLVAAGLLALVAAASRACRRPHARGWAALATLFLLMSIDEAAQVHEVGNQARDVLGTSGYLFFPWVIAGGLLAGTVAIASIGLLRSLPRATAGLFLLAGAIFVVGALGLELLQATAWEVTDAETGRVIAPDTGRVAALAAIEEAMEMAGLTIFILAVSRHLAAAFPDLRVRIAAGRAPCAILTGDEPTRRSPRLLRADGGRAPR